MYVFEVILYICEMLITLQHPRREMEKPNNPYEHRKKKKTKKKQKEANVFLFCIEVETLNKISIKDFKLQQIKLKCIWWKIVNALHLIKSCHEIP